MLAKLRTYIHIYKTMKNDSNTVLYIHAYTLLVFGLIYNPANFICTKQDEYQENYHDKYRKFKLTANFGNAIIR